MIYQVLPLKPIPPSVTTNTGGDEVYLPAYRDDAYYKAMAQMDMDTGDSGPIIKVTGFRRTPMTWEQFQAEWDADYSREFDRCSRHIVKKRAAYRWRLIRARARRCL